MAKNYRELVTAAALARKLSYSPYSDFQVGAALLSRDGRVFTGCNIENAAYGPSNCAERTAVFKAVSEGVRDFEAIAVVGGFAENDGSGELTLPCGVCLQVLLEFCDPAEFVVLSANLDMEYKAYKLAELIPHGFSLMNHG